MVTSTASLVLPTPPAPVTVTSRWSRRRSPRRACSSIRPTKVVSDGGRLPTVSRPRASRAGSCSRICSSNSSRALDGSMPSSSPSRSRMSRNSRSASACRPERYSVRISSARATSSSGRSSQSCCASTVGGVSPARRSASIRSRRAVCRSSSRRAISGASDSMSSMPSYGRPCQRASASAINADAAPGSSGSARRAQARSCSKATESISSASSRTSR